MVAAQMEANTKAVLAAIAGRYCGPVLALYRYGE